MLTLMLLRHAKSDRSEPRLADIDRPLDARGWRAALAMGRHIASRDPKPQLVLCSPARRARATWELVALAFKPEPALRTEPRLYDFGDGMALLDLLRAGLGLPRVALLVGHNPSLEGLALRLAGHGDPLLRQRMAEKYPTGALATLRFDLDAWAQLTEGAGTLVDFVRPKDLAGAAEA
jgi:phosphohistidine phosphatase